MVQKSNLGDWMSSLHDYNETASRFSESYSGSDKSTDLRNHLLKAI